MKKTLKIVLIFMLVLVCYATVVNASSTDKIVEYASKSFEINGKSVKLSDSDVLRIKKYFEQYPVSDEIADQIIAKGDQVIEIMRKANVTDPAKLSKEQKDQVLDLAQSAVELTQANLTYDSSTKTAVITKDGVVVDKINTDTTKLVQTGADNTIYVCLTAVAVIAIATITIVKVKKSKVNA